MKYLLPKKNDYLLSLVNNNYSEKTLESYARDLLIFELFINKYNLAFEAIEKLQIEEYKGYLRTGQHRKDLLNLKKNHRVENSDNEIQDDSDDVQVKDMKILDRALNTELLQKSRSRVSGRVGVGTGGVNSRSINRMLSSLRSYIKFLIDIDHPVPIPPESIKFLKTVKGESQVAEFFEIIKLIESPEIFEKKKNIRLRNRAILELFFSTGMRISELVNLNVEDLNYEVEKNKILSEKIYIYGKGKKRRYVYLTKRCIFNLERYLKIRDDDFPALFVPYRGQRSNNDDLDSIRVSQRYIQTMIKKYRKLNGILVPTTPHSLRHGFATYLAEQGANPAAIQRLLGHESLQTTTRYVHSSDRFAEKSHSDFHPLQD
jgi:site-specific recombinase XerD